MTDKPIDLKVVDTSGLTDADWAEINRLKGLYETGGRNALSKALAELGESDPVRSIRVLSAFFPETVREALREFDGRTTHYGRGPKRVDQEA